MSYEIIYDKQFVKVNEKTFIPMILSGSNNCTEWSPSGRERRSRSWFNFGYLLGYAIAGTMEQMLEKQEEERKERMKSEDYSDKYFGSWSGLRINGTLASYGAYTGIVKTGCKKALTIEQLIEENVYLNIHTYNSNDTIEELKVHGLEPVSFTPNSTEQLEDFIKNVEPKYKGKKGGHLYIGYSGMYESTPKRIRRKYFPTNEAVEKQEVKSSIGYTVKAIDTEKDSTIGYLVSFRGGSFRYSPYNTGGKQHLNKKDADKIAKKMTARRRTIKFVVEQVVYGSERTFRVPAGKKVVLPIEKKEDKQTDEELLASLVLLDEGQEIANMFDPSQKCFLDSVGIALHDLIKGCEVLGLYDKMQQALSIFREKYPEEYYVLLD